MGRLPLSKQPDQAQTIREVMSMTQLADAVGFKRCWLTEHHSCLLDSSPEVLVPLLAATTQRIKVGTAGILLNYYAPYKVAKTFQVLSTLFPGRIDMGVCGGRVSDSLAREGLTLSTKGFEALNSELQACVRANRSQCDSLHPGKTPQHWIVGTGDTSRDVAGRLGASYCYSLCHEQSDADPSILAGFRSLIKDRLRHDEVPETSILVAGICAFSETDAEAMLAEYNNPFVVPTMAGTAISCVQRLHSLAAAYGVSEIVWWDLSPTHAQAERSLTLLAEAMQLRPAA